jgi:hypothetical protein
MIRYICFDPTFQPPVQDGVILYEVHAIRPDPNKIPVPAPKQDLQVMRTALKEKGSLENRVNAYMAAHPDSVAWIQSLAAVLTAAAVVGTIVAVLSPAPGDEFLAASFASLMFRIATQSVKAGV